MPQLEVSVEPYIQFLNTSVESRGCSSTVSRSGSIRLVTIWFVCEYIHISTGVVIVVSSAPAPVNSSPALWCVVLPAFAVDDFISDCSRFFPLNPDGLESVLLVLSIVCRSGTCVSVLSRTIRS